MAADYSQREVSGHERVKMLVELKNIYWKLLTSLREKRLRKQKAMIQMRIMSDYVRRVK
jgi:hypothetical protein